MTKNQKRGAGAGAGAAGLLGFGLKRRGEYKYARGLGGSRRAAFGHAVRTSLLGRFAKRVKGAPGRAIRGFKGLRAARALGKGVRNFR